MDERVKKAIEFSNYRISLFNTKENIKTKVYTMLLHAENGGVFDIDRTLISFVKIVADLNKESVVLIDKNSNPIEITDINEFYKTIVDKYFQATNYYYSEYTKLRRARSVEMQFDEIFKE
jgi:hypothetical protein